MESEQRDKLVSDVKNLQKITRNLEKSSLRLGKSNDTVSWRQTFESELQKGIDLVTSIQALSTRIRAESIDAQADKLLQQNDPIIQKFNELRTDIDNKLNQYQPINDTPSNPFNSNDDGAAYGGDAGYAPPQQQQKQDQIEQIGFVSMAADIDHLEEQNRAVKKIADDVTELKEAFTDLNVLVADQGEQITHIEQNTETAKEQVVGATVHLQKAEKNQKSARKKQCYIMCCCLVLLGLIFALLGGLGIFSKK